MINKKTYIPITKNNLKRSQSILNSKSSNFKTRDDLNKEISFNTKSNRQFKSFKIHGASFPIVNEPVFFNATEFSDNPNIESIVIPPPYTTRINIFFDDSGSMNSTLTPLEDMVGGSNDTLKSIILPYYDNDSAAYDENVTIQKFSKVSPLSTIGRHPDGLRIPTSENSIVLGGTTMREISSSKNVINIMFQDEANGQPLSEFSGLTAGFGSGGIGSNKGSVDFLTGGLTENEKHRAFFFHVATTTIGEQGAQYKTLMVDLSGLLQNTPFRNQTTFTLDVEPGASAATYATLIGRALSDVNENIN